MGLFFWEDSRWAFAKSQWLRGSHSERKDDYNALRRKTGVWYSRNKISRALEKRGSSPTRKALEHGDVSLLPDRLQNRPVQNDCGRKKWPSDEGQLVYSSTGWGCAFQTGSRGTCFAENEKESHCWSLLQSDSSARTRRIGVVSTIRIRCRALASKSDWARPWLRSLLSWLFLNDANEFFSKR